MSGGRRAGKIGYYKPICRAARNSNTPGGGVRNSNRGRSRERDCKQKNVTGFCRAREVSSALPPTRALESSQVSVEVFRTPVLNDNRKDSKNWYREEIVVKHGIPIRKTCGLDSFAHRKHLCEHRVSRRGTVAITSRDHIGSTGSTVDHHPEVADIQVPHNAGNPRKVD